MTLNLDWSQHPKQFTPVTSFFPYSLNSYTRSPTHWYLNSTNSSLLSCTSSTTRHRLIVLLSILQDLSFLTTSITISLLDLSILRTGLSPYLFVNPSSMSMIFTVLSRVGHSCTDSLPLNVRVTIPVPRQKKRMIVSRTLYHP